MKVTSAVSAFYTSRPKLIKWIQTFNFNYQVAQVSNYNFFVILREQCGFNK